MDIITTFDRQIEKNASLYMMILDEKNVLTFTPETKICDLMTMVANIDKGKAETMVLTELDKNHTIQQLWDHDIFSNDVRILSFNLPSKWQLVGVNRNGRAFIQPTRSAFYNRSRHYRRADNRKKQDVEQFLSSLQNRIAQEKLETSVLETVNKQLGDDLTTKVLAKLPMISEAGQFQLPVKNKLSLSSILSMTTSVTAVFVATSISLWHAWKNTELIVFFKSLFGISQLSSSIMLTTLTSLISILSLTTIITSFKESFRHPKVRRKASSHSQSPANQAKSTVLYTSLVTIWQGLNNTNITTFIRRFICMIRHTCSEFLKIIFGISSLGLSLSILAAVVYRSSSKEWRSTQPYTEVAQEEDAYNQFENSNTQHNLSD